MVDFFNNYSNAIQLIMYYDEIEVCNPLGAKKGIHKLGKLFLKQDGVRVPGTDILLYCTVFLLLADTMAAHQLCGFKVGVGRALRKCRDCNATFELIQTKVILMIIYNNIKIMPIYSN